MNPNTTATKPFSDAEFTAVNQWAEYFKKHPHMAAGGFQTQPTTKPQPPTRSNDEVPMDIVPIGLERSLQDQLKHDEDLANWEREAEFYRENTEKQRDEAQRQMVEADKAAEEAEKYRKVMNDCRDEIIRQRKVEEDKVKAAKDLEEEKLREKTWVERAVNDGRGTIEQMELAYQTQQPHFGQDLCKSDLHI